MKTQRSCSLRCLGRFSFVIICLSSTLAINAKSINKSPSSSLVARPDERDPMLALPSDDGRRQYDHQLQPAPVAASGQQQEVHYVTSYQQAQPVADYHQQQQQQQQAGGHQLVVEYQVPAQVELQQQQQQPQPQQAQQNQQHEQQVVYSRPQYQLVEMSVPASQVQVVNQREQAATNEQAGVSGEYPGEIIYLGQNGEAISEQQQQQGGSLSSVASSLAHNSGLSATILTEVPVRDMPAEVLNKLRREYGVKVVATRERPGANLVINCDEHPAAGQESSICNKQQPHTYEYHQEHPSEHPKMQHHHSSPPQMYSVEHELAQPQEQPGHEAYHHHGEERGVVDELLHNGPQYHHSQPEAAASPASGEHEQAGDSRRDGAEAGQQTADEQPKADSEYYGSRTTVAAGGAPEQPTEAAESYEGRSADQTNSGDNSGHEQATVEHASHEAPSSSVAHEETDQSAGFEEQPKSEAHAQYNRQ